MKNIIFIKETNYNDSLVGPQLNNILEKSVYLNGKWCCDSDSIIQDNLFINITLDNMCYQANNFILSKQFENIILSWNFSDLMLQQLINHLDSETYNLTIFNLTNTETEDDIASFELANRVYESDYSNISNKLVKISYIDTTNCSAFKIAKTLEMSIAK